MQNKPKKKQTEKINYKNLIGLIILGALASLIIVQLGENRRQPEPPVLMASAYALVDLDTGTALLEHEPGLSLKLGSLTKLAPVYICFMELEQGGISLNDKVTVSAAAANKSGSAAGLAEGAEITLDALLYCALMPSGNDAVTAISEYICGSEQAMVERMNRTAAGLGMADTKYTDCAGINSFDNRSTVRDLTLLVIEMLRSCPQVTGYTSVPEKTVRLTAGGEEIELTLTSTNKLFGKMRGVYGLKTGTAAGSFNAIALAGDKGKNLMAIVLDAPDDAARWDSVKALLEYGYNLH